ncbi:MAG: hypothetical protein EOL95_08355 [Bacteroidia bacterium]|nr:hypothetical protein [Bacteroidia bacterium]
MKIAELVANTIDRLPSDYVFTCADFNVEAKQKNTVVKALNTLATAGKITKLSKGKFYKPRRTQFGELKPSAYQIAKDFIEQNGKIKEIVRGLSVEQQTAFATLAIKYTNYVRALCGAILEDIGVEVPLLSKLEKSLNGVTEYKLPISEKTLPYKSKWNIK